MEFGNILRRPPTRPLVVAKAPPRFSCLPPACPLPACRHGRVATANRHGGLRRAAWLATGSACGAGHEERWAASSPHQRRLLRGRLLARFGGSGTGPGEDWARRERERGTPVLPFGPGFLVLSWAAPGRLRHGWFYAVAPTPWHAGDGGRRRVGPCLDGFGMIGIRLRVHSTCQDEAGA